jgi:hypothetical protein
MYYLKANHYKLKYILDPSKQAVNTHRHMHRHAWVRTNKPTKWNQKIILNPNEYRIRKGGKEQKE